MSAVEALPAEPNVVKRSASGPWTDLGLTLPLFVAYHLGVVFLPVRNAADWVTRELIQLADNNMSAYGGLTLAIAIVYIGVLAAAGRGKALRWSRFAGLAVEAVVYAIAMRTIAGYVVGRVVLSQAESAGPLSGFVLSAGAGFYEEIAFRVGLFGMGYKLCKLLIPMTPLMRPAVWLIWAVVSACIFSLWHYVGPMGDPLDAQSFVFRAVCGLVFTFIYAFRGFAPAVWTHALYDMWVLVL